MGTYNFVIMAIAAGLGLSLITGPIGCFLLWKRMAFFGDALSHSALLGVVLGTILHIDIHLGIVVVCILMFVFVFLNFIYVISNIIYKFIYNHFFRSFHRNMLYEFHLISLIVVS